MAEKRLAREIVTQLYNQEVAAKAEERFENVVQRKEVPEDIREHNVKQSGGIGIRELLVEANLVGSLSEASRLIVAGSVSFEGNKITDRIARIERTGIIKVGKIRFVKVVILGT